MQNHQTHLRTLLGKHQSPWVDLFDEFCVPLTQPGSHVLFTRDTYFWFGDRRVGLELEPLLTGRRGASFRAEHCVPAGNRPMETCHSHQDAPAASWPGLGRLLLRKLITSRKRPNCPASFTGITLPGRKHVFVHLFEQQFLCWWADQLCSTISRFAKKLLSEIEQDSVAFPCTECGPMLEVMQVLLTLTFWRLRSWRM